MRLNELRIDIRLKMCSQKSCILHGGYLRGCFCSRIVGLCPFSRNDLTFNVAQNLHELRRCKHVALLLPQWGFVSDHEEGIVKFASHFSRHAAVVSNNRHKLFLRRIKRVDSLQHLIHGLDARFARQTIFKTRANTCYMLIFWNYAPQLFLTLQTAHSHLEPWPRTSLAKFCESQLPDYAVV